MTAILVTVITASLLTAITRDSAKSTITHSGNTIVFAPEADVYVNEAEADKNYGALTSLLVDQRSEYDSRYQTYLRFAIKDVSGPVQSAKLRVYAYNGSPNGPALYATSDNNWSETEITWNNRPRRTSEVGVIDDRSAVNGWMEYDVTSIVTGDGIYSFVFVPASENGVDIYSREGEFPPQLVLTLATKPDQAAAKVETTPVPHSGDAADDPAIWIHPSDPAQSTIIGADKQGGLAVYDLAGEELQYVPDGKMNNVDLRTDFPLGDQSVSLVTASNSSTNSIAIYQVDTATRQLKNVAARTITTISPAYGACMYRSASTGKFYYFVNNKAGDVEQWELFDNGSGQVDGRVVRTFAVGGRTEGCVADDEVGHLYIGEEKMGIWKYGAEPDAETVRTLVDRTGAGGNLTIDAEGLTIAYGANGSGYLIASSQGNSSFAVYDRQGMNTYLKSFEIPSRNGIDDVKQTDGIDVTTGNLGPAFPHGVFVAQDGYNDNGNQNFKLVPWQSIINLLSTPEGGDG
jgi:3-phytase